MRVLLIQLDGKIPNLALMRLAAHHRARGDEVSFRFGTGALEPDLFEQPDKIYASIIFTASRPRANKLLQTYPSAILGGTGWDVRKTLTDVDVTTQELDYSIYPRYRQSLGFTQRGCRLACSFCVVPEKEGKVREEQNIGELFREGQKYFDGAGWRDCPRELVLLDNDFFGQVNWRERIREMRDGDFKVSFNQGINARMLNDEAAEAIASVRYYDDQMKTRRIYTAWDSRKDESTLFRGLNALVRYGVKPVHIMVYMLIGFWPGETEDDWLYRQSKLREFGAMPYPMPFVRTPETIGFQRFIIGAYDKRFTWSDWKRAQFRPERLGLLPSNQLELSCDAADVTGN